MANEMCSWSALRSLEARAHQTRLKLTLSDLVERERNRYSQELVRLEASIVRQRRARELYDRLGGRPVIVHRRPPSHVNVRSVQQPVKSAFSSSLPIPAVEENHNSLAFLHDLTLPRSAPVDKRSLAFMDVCQCGAMMHRHATKSYLICPVCSLKRIEIDMCAKDTSVPTADYLRHTHHVKHTHKTASHYGTFLNTNRSRRRNVDPERLALLCKYAYVEGARLPSDITHRLINLAQKHTGYVEYPATRTYVALLRDDNVRIPDAVKGMLVKLYQYMQPVYSKCKHEMDDSRTNMPKFTFLSRILCRLLGLDVLVPLFDNFSMSKIVVRRTAFMRRVFRRLGWEWSDAISDVPEAELDAFERENGAVEEDDIVEDD